MEPKPSHSNPPRARTILASTVLVFVAAQLAVGLALDRAPLPVRFHEAQQGLDRLRARGDSPDVAIFGSSRTNALTDPHRVEARLRETLGGRAPNVTLVGFNGGDLVASDIMLDKVLAAGMHPKLVVIELTPEWMRFPVPFLNGQLLRAFTWRDVAHWLPELARGTRTTTLCARLFPVYCYRTELLVWLTGTQPPYLTAPVKGGEKKVTRPDDPQHGAHRWARRMRNYRVSPRAVAVLERVLDRCRAERIECVFIEPPISTTHQEMLAGHIADTFAAEIARIRAERSFEFLDFSTRLPDAGFHDSTHGNRWGEERFSEIVADEVIAPRWRARAE